MSYFVLLQLRNSLREKCIFQRCVSQLRSSFYQTNGQIRNIQGDHPFTKERRERRKALRTKLLRELRQKTKLRVEKIIERENIWTVPNFLSIGRIIVTPCLGYLILSQDYQTALCLFGFAGLSDLADGWIARTWTSQASKLGSFLDPVADKLLVGTLFLSLAWVGLIPMPLTYLVVARDITLVIAAGYVRYNSLPHPKTFARYCDPTYATVQLAPTLASKFNTGVQLLLVAGTLAAPVFHFVDHPLLHGLRVVTAVTTIIGGLSYLVSKDTYTFLAKKRILKEKRNNSH